MYPDDPCLSMLAHMGLTACERQEVLRREADDERLARRPKDATPGRTARPAMTTWTSPRRLMARAWNRS